MTLKHTPGPWRIGDAGKTIFGPKVEGLLPVTVARVAGGSIATGHLPNARLIAAAPELLEALKRCVSILEDEYPSTDCRYPHTERAIIAKLEDCEHA